jgi:Retrotransposon gag protein
MELAMEDEGIVENEAKVKYVGRYLRDDAWEWFEPIIRERNEINREDWSPRAKRILTSYSEMKKAMKQALGDIDERKTAAQELQKLRQTRVREYITKFQRQGWAGMKKHWLTSFWRD